MKHLCIISLILVLLHGSAWGQTNPEDACRLEGDSLVIQLDNRWNIAQRQTVMSLFNLDSSLLADAFKPVKGVEVNGIEWRVRKLDANRVEIIKPLTGGEDSEVDLGDILMLDDDLIGIGRKETERLSAASGINKLTRFGVFSYRKGIALFYLPDRLQARQVYLSGTFNNWSTLNTPMQRTDSGWIVRLPLQPGKYQYKYIIDGRWSQDPYNRLEENDWAGGNNSVIFCYNYRFYLPGFPDASEVWLAGSFNNWNNHTYRMLKVPGGWAIHLFLREGTHAYKYVVDGEWMLDPVNPTARPDGRGNINSFVSLGDTLWFRLPGFTDAQKVVLSGNFNAWNQGELYMKKTAGGWELPYVLAPGNYEYKFIVDGRWMVDPENPITTGSGDYTNSFLTVNPNYAFRLKEYTDAKQVILSGSFNGWSEENYRMIRQTHQWIFPLYLTPGKYAYKFIVDNQWMPDPGNDWYEENKFGTNNSVIWILPE